MRQLHSVAFHEKFTASGTYIYDENGEPAGITESWTIHTLPDQSQRIRVDHDERNIESGITILLEALSNMAGMIQRFDVRLENPNGKSVKLARASYTLFTNHVQIGRQINDQPRQDEVISLPPNTVIYPLMHVFTGSIIHQIIQLGGTDISVFFPNITHPDDYQVLSGIIEPRSVTAMDTNHFHFGDRRNAQQGIYQLDQTRSVTAMDTNHFHFGDRRNAQQGIYQLDQTGLLTAYEINSMRVTLKNLARSNTFAS
jgi:hypothetical protein